MIRVTEYGQVLNPKGEPVRTKLELVYSFNKLTACQIYSQFMNFKEGQIKIPLGGSVEIEVL